MELVVHVDGGARGNPGPSAIAAVVSDSAGQVITERGETIGVATNNVAEYKALLLGIAMATEEGGTEVEFVGDSELIVKQIRGEYKVKDAGLKPLHAEARGALAKIPSWSIRHVKRAQNARADALVNQALDGA